MSWHLDRVLRALSGLGRTAKDTGGVTAADLNDLSGTFDSGFRGSLLPELVVLHTAGGWHTIRSQDLSLLEIRIEGGLLVHSVLDKSELLEGSLLLRILDLV